jgi:predicted lipid-binding transport protein (Tim44 family)
MKSNKKNRTAIAIVAFSMIALLGIGFVSAQSLDRPAITDEQRENHKEFQKSIRKAFETRDFVELRELRISRMKENRFYELAARKIHPHALERRIDVDAIKELMQGVIKAMKSGDKDKVAEEVDNLVIPEKYKELVEHRLKIILDRFYGVNASTGN